MDAGEAEIVAVALSVAIGAGETVFANKTEGGKSTSPKTMASNKTVIFRMGKNSLESAYIITDFGKNREIFRG